MYFSCKQVITILISLLKVWHKRHLVYEVNPTWPDLTYPNFWKSKNSELDIFHFLNLVKVCFSAFEHCIIILINLYCQQHVTLNCFMFVLVYLKSNQIFTSFQAETAKPPYLNLMIIGFSAFSEGCLIIRSIFKMQLMYSSHSKRGLVCVCCA